MDQTESVVMRSDRTYYAEPALAQARRLQRAGDWDGALSLLPRSAPAAVLRAEILVDRHTWSLDPLDETLAAIRAIADDEPDVAALLIATLEYWRQKFKCDDAVRGPDPVAEFARLDSPDARLAPGWATFWHGVTLDHLARDSEGAQAHYRRALGVALDEEDLLLESYVVRHQGFYLLKQDRDAGITLLRRSLYLRAGCGARPHVAAAQAGLADALGVGPESVLLNRLVANTARELNLVWLKPDSDVNYLVED
jgi:hypothetical protein